MVSRVVLTLVSLLYPLEYVYPVIPLLPARLNQAAEVSRVTLDFVLHLHNVIVVIKMLR